MMVDLVFVDVVVVEREIVFVKIKGLLYGVLLVVKDFCWIKGVLVVYGMIIYCDFCFIEDVMVVV